MLKKTNSYISLYYILMHETHNYLDYMLANAECHIDIS
jgi:hypothetical protein